MFRDVSNPDLLTEVLQDGSIWKDAWLQNLQRTLGHSPVLTDIEPLAPLITYLSGRDGFHTTQMTLSAPLNILTSCSSFRWSLLTITHEMSHRVIDEVLGYILPKPSDSAEMKKAVAILNEEEEPRNLLECLQFKILWSIAALNAAGSQIKSQDKVTEKHLIDLLGNRREEIEEIMVHVFDFIYFYSHLLLTRWGGDRLILLSTDYRICDHFIQHDFRPSLPISVRKTDINVHGLIDGMIEFRKDTDERRRRERVGDKTDHNDPIAEREPQPIKPENIEEWARFNESFDVGYAFARTDAFGGSLQKIEFTGKDLIAAPLFIEAFSVTRFRTCGLRKRMVDSHGLPDSYELVKIGRNGFLSFSVPTSPTGREQRFKEVESVLRSINRCGFIT